MDVFSIHDIDKKSLSYVYGNFLLCIVPGNLEVFQKYLFDAFIQPTLKKKL